MQSTDVRGFFANCDDLDRAVLRPLAHVRSNWELEWDPEKKEYVPEESSFAALLNSLVEELVGCEPPAHYHDNEDRLAGHVVRELHWPIRKERGRWIGADYDVILQQGGLRDVNQEELVTAAVGRVWAALKRGQTHFDDMEVSHRRMLGAVLAVILWCRSDFE